MSGGGLTLITGGAGFIGTNLAERLLEQGRDVLLFDNLHRAGVEANAAALVERFGSSRARLIRADVRDEHAVERAVAQADEVYHFAAQVAVTSSLDDPRSDFEVNALGTLTLLERLRRLSDPPPLVFTSTNKVYGELEDLRLRLDHTGYRPQDEDTWRHGIGETRQLAFHSPYGCSKGCADQYVLDYARTFGLPATVFRMSCIYGPHQFGTEDQGWVAHFVFAALDGEPVTIFGDGQQVRDLLFAADLVDALLAARTHINGVAGRAFNIGGGPTRATSLLSLIGALEQLSGRRIVVDFAPWRRADQRYYVSDTRAFTEATGWRSRTSLDEGLERLFVWATQARSRVAALTRAAAV